jgi:hypothetical protein
MNGFGDGGPALPHLQCQAHPRTFQSVSRTGLQVPGSAQEALYVTGRVAGPAGGQVLLELRLTAGQPGVDVSFKSEKAELAAMTFDAVAAVLSKL